MAFFLAFHWEGSECHASPPSVPGVYLNSLPLGMMDVVVKIICRVITGSNNVITNIEIWSGADMCCRESTTTSFYVKGV